jgi:protein-tyrosine phosphatase
LSQGHLVAFPTDGDCQIAANVLCTEAVDQLTRLGNNTAATLTLALPSAAHALDWAPAMGPLARRLARRCWPGPVTLVTSEGVEQGLASRLPESVRRCLCPEGSLWLYVPGHEALAETLQLLPAPLVLKPTPPTATVESLHSAIGGELAVIVSDGPSRPLRPCSVVRVQGQDWTMLQEGAISAQVLGRKTACVILFVCTGNTCRSPMAASLCRKLLAERLHCSPAQLPEHGYVVLSAGMAAMPGDSASPEAVDVVRDLGADLSDHASRPLTDDLVLQADHLLTMTRGHQAAVSARYSRYGPQPRLLDPEGRDISDPVGAEREVYRECAQEILRDLERFVAELPIKES